MQFHYHSFVQTYHIWISWKRCFNSSHFISWAVRITFKYVNTVAIRDFRLLRLELDEKCALLGYYTSSGNSLLAFQDNESFLDSEPLKMGPIDCPVILHFVDHASLYNLVNKTNLVHNLFFVYLYLSISTYFGRLWAHHQEKQLCLCYCGCGWLSGMPRISVSHPQRITSTKCHINIVVSPDDGPIVAQNV